MRFVGKQREGKIWKCCDWHLQKHCQMLVGYAHYQGLFLALLLGLVEDGLQIDSVSEGPVLFFRDSDPCSRRKSFQEFG